MRFFIPVLAWFATFWIAAPTWAQVRPQSVEATAYGGIWEGDDVLDSGAVFGVRAKFNINRVLGVEGVYGAVFTEKDAATIVSETGNIEKGDQTIQQAGLNAVIHLSKSALTPYITAGVGFVSVDDTSFATNLGMGATYSITDLVGVRLDLRNWFSSDALAADNYSHFEATGGVVFQFGGNDDLDADGIRNPIDGCPTQAEDKDGFKDDDGCPDTDNDEDGIVDADDKCIDKAEDKDGDRDDDGCPDIDDDNDGIENEVDKCIDKAEDKDGFEDEDGCPDPDNDGDGITDDKDKCPNQAELINGVADEDGCPEGDNDKDGIFDEQDGCKEAAETFNGFEDVDGCPDDIPVDLQGVLGIRPDVRFKRNASGLNKASRTALDGVATVLAKYPTVVIVLQATAHKSKDDQALSQARAEAVRVYLTTKSIETGRLRVNGLGAKPLPDSPPAGARADRLELGIEVPDKPATPAADPKTPEAPNAEEKKPEAPKAEEKKPEAPKAEEKKPEAPKPEEKKPEAPKAEEKKPEAPKPEEKKPAATE